MISIPITVPYQKYFMVFAVCRIACGNNSATLTVTIVPATNASIFCKQNIPSDSFSIPLRTNIATKAPAGSANPDTVAKTKLNHGLSGRAARHGMAIAIPSGICEGNIF